MLTVTVPTGLSFDALEEALEEAGFNVEANYYLVARTDDTRTYRQKEGACSKRQKQILAAATRRNRLRYQAIAKRKQNQAMWKKHGLSDADDARERAYNWADTRRRAQ